MSILKHSWDQLPAAQRASWDKLFAATQPPIKLLKLINSQLQLESYVPTMMSEMVHNDPLLAGRLLAAANSAAISPVEPVTSIRRALMLLGFLVVRSITMTYLLEAMFSEATKRNPQLAQYMHQWLCAASIITYHWAAEAGIHDADTMSTAVLLSRIGTLLAATEGRFSSEYITSQDELWRAEYELERWSVASPLLSAEQVRRWGIPEPVPGYIANQREPLIHELHNSPEHIILTIMCASLPLSEQAITDTSVPPLDCLRTPSYYALQKNVFQLKLEASLIAAWDKHIVHDLGCILHLPTNG